jgi:hypothetical protein
MEESGCAGSAVFSASTNCITVEWALGWHRSVDAEPVC